MKIEVDMKEYNREGKNCTKYLVYDVPNDVLYVVSNFSCPATVYKFISKHYYDYDIDRHPYYKNFKNFWYNPNEPLTGQVYKNVEKKIQANLDS